MQYHNKNNNNNTTAYPEENLDSYDNLKDNIDSKNNNLEDNNSLNNEQILKQKVDEFKNKYLRALAELENLKKHNSKMLEDANCYAISKFAKDLLNVMDVFNKALDTVDVSKITDSTFKSFVDGIKLTKQELNKIFKKFNITILNDNILGQPFDPNFHEALLAKEDKNKDNETIFEVFESGYLLKDKLLRPAKVGIIKNS